MDFKELTVREIKAVCREIDHTPHELEIAMKCDKYMVLTDEEATDMAADYIKDTLWAFNPSFLSGETGIDEDVFKAIQDNGKCESNNTAIERLIEDIDNFIDDAISADGRGHFLNTYDGNEIEVFINAEGHKVSYCIYVYRIN